MKKSIAITVIATILGMQLPAQVPNQFNYQAVARNATGQNIPNASIRLRITILDGGVNGASVYSEERQTITNQLGLFTAAIGGPGAVSSTGNFATINWATGNKFIKVEADPLGGNNFTLLGNTEMLSVPYALYAVNGKIGPVGPPNVLNIGAITTGAPGSQASASITGSSPAQTLNLTIPTGAVGPQGNAGPQGTVGPQGIQGIPGSNTLIKTTTEPAGANCATGGVKHEYGIDANGNGVLDAGEINAALTKYVCNGATGSAANAWALTGNTGTTSADFIGNADNQPIRFGINSNIAGIIDPSNSNTAYGQFTLQSNTTGLSNTANGYNALASNTGGKYNTASGSGALNLSTNGDQNVAIGSDALGSNTIGNFNTAIGVSALSYNADGSGNVAVGNGSMSSSLNTSSINCVAVGYNSGPLPNPLGNYDNSISIGSDVHASYSNVAQIGSFFMVQIGGFKPWSTFSDGRFKRGIKENVKGLDFIMQLRPVTYTVDYRGLEKFQGIPADTAITQKIKSFKEASIAIAEAKIQSGFIAQDVLKAAETTGYDFDGVNKPQHDKDNYSIAYSQFVVPLVKAVQEQQQQIEELKKEIKELKKLQTLKN